MRRRDSARNVLQLCQPSRTSLTVKREIERNSHFFIKIEESDRASACIEAKIGIHESLDGMSFIKKNNTVVHSFILVQNLPDEVPVVWSTPGPVCPLCVGPRCNVNVASLKNELDHWQRSFSKLHGALATTVGWTKRKRDFLL